MVKVKRLGFRARLFAILLLFAVLPSALLTALWAGTFSAGLSAVTASAAWDSIAVTGVRALEEARGSPLTPEAEAALRAHEQELRTSVEQARRLQALSTRAVPLILVVGFLAVAVLSLVASRVAGHLSRQLSRPLSELVDWTERIARREPLPEGQTKRGAPEFGMLRRRMRVMARELEAGRARALEAERFEAFRETARRVAHELKNPLTPIRFAVARLKREAPEPLRESVEVLEVESRRLEDMARSFAQFGRLPEGPKAEVDLGELARYAARSTVPEGLGLAIDVEPELPLVRGHHDALSRALSNVLINAVDACREGGEVGVSVRRRRDGGGRAAIEIVVRDTGCGIPPEQLPHIWDPYVTHKRGGTGLGLAIARQTILAHDGAVDATSAAGRGTEVRFILPVEETGEPRGGDS
jgi:signal transduction histidine kinase